MLRVWVDRTPVGVVDRLGKRGATMSYDAGADPELKVSMRMPVRVQSYDTPHNILPFLDMNLPEGALREALRLRFAKAVGTFDDMDILTITGRSQIGRVRLTPMEAGLDEDVPFQSVDDILRARRGGDLYDYLMDTFARHSGLSGVQPKAMIRGVGDPREGRQSQSLRGASHIVKLWDAGEYPELAANEFFCLQAAKASGLRLPGFRLSDTGDALVVDRFDLRPDGTYRGFEDFCVLNLVTSESKYNGSYESAVFKLVKDLVPPESSVTALRELFKLTVLNCAVRNGDAHLKNFGLVYDTPTSGVALAPVYDIVTTQAYLPKDPMALLMNGSTNWPERKQLVRLGQGRAAFSPSDVARVMEEVADGMSEAAADARAYFEDCPTPEIGERMLTAWEAGVRHSLGHGDRAYVTVPADAPRP